MFIALGGSSYAAIKITGKNVKDGTLTGADAKHRSFLAQDFKSGQLPAGAQGPKGDTGATGVQGPQGPPGADGTTNGVAAGGALDGTFPNPTLQAEAVTSDALANGAITLRSLSSSVQRAF